MFKDMALSRDLVTAYRESVENRSPVSSGKGKSRASSDDGPKATFMVLQASSWPFAPKDKDADLPPYVSDQTRSLLGFQGVDYGTLDVGATQQLCKILQEEAWQQGIELGSRPRKCFCDRKFQRGEEGATCQPVPGSRPSPV